MTFEKLIVVFGGILFAAVFGLQVYHAYTFNIKLNSFVNKGPRFTASDGQGLCERVAELEKQLKLPAKPCLYLPK